MPLAVVLFELDVTELLTKKGGFRNIWSSLPARSNSM